MLRQTIKRALRRVRERSIPVAVYRGSEGQVTIVGSEPRGPSLAEYFCGDDAQLETMESIARGHVSQVVAERVSAYGPLILRSGAGGARADADHAVAVPSLVSIRVHLPGDVETLREKLVTSTTREDFRRIRKAGFSYRITDDPEVVLQFHAEHYVPIVVEQHPDDGRIVASSTMLKALRRGGELVCADIDGTWVAGILNEVRPDHYALAHLGILNADPDVRRKRVVSALIVRSLERAVELGIDRATLGKSLPFLGIGPVWFKAKWGGEVSHDDADPILHMFLDLRQGAVRKMLAASPVLHRTGPSLSASVWLEPGDEPLKVVRREAERIQGLDRWFVLGEPATLATADLSTDEHLHPIGVNPDAEHPLWLGDLIRGGPGERPAG